MSFKICSVLMLFCSFHDFITCIPAILHIYCVYVLPITPMPYYTMCISMYMYMYYTTVCVCTYTFVVCWSVCKLLWKHVNLVSYNVYMCVVVYVWINIIRMNTSVHIVNNNSSSFPQEYCISYFINPSKQYFGWLITYQNWMYSTLPSLSLTHTH